MAEITSLFYPESRIRIGQYTFTKGVNIDVYSANDTYYDWAKIRMQQALAERATVNPKEEVEVQLGYNGKLQTIFQGFVYKEGDSASAEGELLCKDDMLKLESIKITETFMDVLPEEIVQYCLNKAGIQNRNLFENKYPKKKIVPIVQKTGLQILEEVKRLWGISGSFYFAGGVFYFGQKHKQEKLYTFEYGNNIISLSKENGQWILETASVPFIRHSDVINLIHPKVSGEQTVIKVIFTSQSGFIRTRIHF